MFRQKVLDRINAPDSLDQLLVVVTPKTFLTFASLGAVLIVALVWSVVAQIPITVDGTGVLLKPRSVKTVQGEGGGQVIAIPVIVGEEVQAGQVIAEIAQPELQRQLEQDVARYTSLASFNERADQQAVRKRDLEYARIESSLEGLESSIASLSGLRERIRSQLDELGAVEQQELARTQSLLEQLQTSQSSQLRSIDELVAEGLSSRSQRLSVQGAVTDTKSRIADLQVRIKQTALSRIDAEQQDLRTRQELESLAIERKQLEIRKQQVTQEYDFEVQRRGQELDQVANSIRLTKERLHRQSVVRSGFDGRVLEMSVSAGQLLSSGKRIAMLQVDAQQPFIRVQLGEDARAGTFRLEVAEDSTGPLRHDIREGELQAALAGLLSVESSGLRPEVTAVPGQNAFDIVFREPGSPDVDLRFSLIVDDTELRADGGLPTFASVSVLGDRVADEPMQHLAFFPIALGKRIEPGMTIRMSPTNIERQRFGAIVGKVTNVSPFPVSTEAVVNLVGSTDVAKNLLAAGGPILVEATPITDETSPTGLKWTSRGPDSPITAGTTTTCRVTVEERRPISFAIPLLRKWLLGEGDQPAA